MDRIDLNEYLTWVGYACDVGANDGIFNSNTVLYENTRGWTVLCIEPNPLLEELGRSHQRKLWRQVAAGSRDEEARTFWAAGDGNYASASRIDLGHGKDFVVKVRTLDRLLEEAGFPRLDFLTVDTEGWEEEVMKGFDQNRWKPKIIMLEHYARPEFPANSDINNPMKVDGYDPIGVAGAEGFDVVYLRKAGT